MFVEPGDQGDDGWAMWGGGPERLARPPGKSHEWPDWGQLKRVLKQALIKVER